MSSIGLIFHEDRALETLPEDWVPRSLGARTVVNDVVNRHMPEDVTTLSLHLRIESPEESEEPRTISVSGVWGDAERRVIKAICDELGARFYDAEKAGFVDL